MQVTGTGSALGLDAGWTLEFDADDGLGFRDEVAFGVRGEGREPQDDDDDDDRRGSSPPPLHTRSGYDPIDDCAWDVELGSGVCRRTVADGAHRSMLVSWVRTGQWLNGATARARLNVKLIRRGAPLAALVAEHTMVRWGGEMFDARRAEPEPPREAAEDDDGGIFGALRGRRDAGRKGKGKGKGKPGGGGRKKKKRAATARDRADPRGRATASVAGPPPAVPGGGGILVALAVRGGRIGARLWLEEATMLPHRLEVATPEGVETWVFDRWTSAGSTGFALPGVAHQTLPAGNSCRYDMTGATVTEVSDDEQPTGGVEHPGGAALPPPSSSSARAFAPPYRGAPAWSTARWAEAEADPMHSVTAARGDGGHVLVLPRLDGCYTPGWFVLDTSCAGFAVDPSAADACGMDAFGRLSVVGVSAAALSGRMRRGRTISLGACTVPNPLYMEQALGAALRVPPVPTGNARGAGGDGLDGLVGVLGTDFLQHCVVELRAPKRVPGSPNAPTFTVAVHEPNEYRPSDRCAAAWQRVEWIGGVPHVRVKVTVADDRLTSLEPAPEAAVPKDRALDEHDGGGEWSGRLFRLSLGTGGTGAIVSARAAAEWDMVARTIGLQPGGVMSGPGQDRSRFARVEPEVVTGRLARLEFKGASFDTVRALTHTGGDPPDLALSPHADGAVCADLLRGCVVVLDLGNDRIAVTQTHTAA